MFQYALARSLAKKYNARLKLDISYYHNQPHKDTPRTFELNQLCIVDNILNSSSFSEEFLYIYDKLRVKLSKKISLPYFRNIVTPVNFNCIDFAEDKDYYFLGHFQELSNIYSIDESLRSEFKPNQEIMNLAHQSKIYELIKQSRGSVALHIRRGDYVTNKNAAEHHGVIGLSYYVNALSYLENVSEFFDVFVFSDDPEWARKNIKNSRNLFFCDEGNCRYSKKYSTIDMYLMSQCDHFIIANSTYSWWAAWLGNYPSKHVVAPARWNANNSPYPILQNWKAIHE